MDLKYEEQFKKVLTEFSNIYMEVGGHSKGEMIKSILMATIDYKYVSKYLTEENLAILADDISIAIASGDKDYQLEYKLAEKMMLILDVMNSDFYKTV